MKRTLISAGLLVSLLSSTVVQAKHFTPIKTPVDFKEVKEMVINKIPDELAKAQCGGWDVNQSVSDKISVVSGVPGRAGEPLGNVPSGMAARIEKGEKLDDGFQFPTTTEGLSTACNPNTSKITKSVWSNTGVSDSGLPGGFVKKEFAYPRFENPPCLWRNEKAPVVNPKFEDYTKKDKELDPPHNEEKCIEFCKWLNRWRYTDCAVVETQYATVNNKKVAVGYKCAAGQTKQRYLCTDHFVGTTDPCTPGSSTKELSNATGCKGEECRCPGPGCRTSPVATFEVKRLTKTDTLKHPKSITHDYKSYYRSYEASYTRAKVKTDNKQGSQSKDVASESKIPIACYGIYSEFDTKKVRTGPNDRRCVIELDVTKRPETQKGKGTWGEKIKVKDEELIKRDPDYDAAKDLWYPNLGGGISFLSEKVFHGTYDKDLSTALLTVDTAKIKVTKVANTASSSAGPAAGSASSTSAPGIPPRPRAFDDTVSNERKDERTIVEWWQKFETDAHKLFTPPIVRLFVPPTWSFGVDHLDPIYQGAATQSSAGNRKDTRMEAIEIQVHAKEDLLGQIASYLERSLLLKIEEEPIPVVVPLGSPTEFRAYAQAWQTAINVRSKPDGTPLNGQGAIIDRMKKYRDQMEKYADQAESVRTLRAELPRYIGTIAESQNKIVKEIAAWMEQNLTTYKNFLNGRAERLAFQKKWIDVQQAYVNFHDKTNMQWCRNDRFTTPIYSLLDPWMLPEGKSGAPRDLSAKGALPQLILPETEPDLIFDFSNLRITAGTAVIPVLKPTLVRVSVTLPKEGMTVEDVPKAPFPEFPPIPTIYKEIVKEVPKVEVTIKPGTIITPKPVDLGAATDALDDALKLIKDMDKEYKKFWESLPQRKDPDWEPPTCGSTNGGQKKDLKALECCGWNQTQCAHVEMDLMERLTRISARPAVLLKEDFASNALGLSSSSVKATTPTALKTGSASSPAKRCDPKDTVCLVLHPETLKQADGWQIKFVQASSTSSSASNAITTLRNTVRHTTLTETGGLYGKYLPYSVTPEQLYPTFGVPRRVPLSPPRSASSSSKPSS